MFKILILSLIFLPSFLLSKPLPIYTKVYLSNYSSESSEIVNDPSTNKKISELIWEIENTSLLGIGFHIPSKNNFKLNLSYQTMLGKNNGTMNDYDWLKDYTTEWSDWSTHPNTKITNISILDINLQYDFKKDKYGNNYIIYGGYKVEEHGFEAYDGSYIYTDSNSTNSNDFRQKSGSFNGLGITYKETFKSLYLKGMFEKYIDDFVFKGFLTYSPFVIVTNEDTHHFRSFTNTNTFDATSMYEVGFGISYYFRKDLALGFDYTKRVYLETDGNTNRYYYDTTTDKYDDGTLIPKGTTSIYSGAGIKNESTTNTFLQLTFKF